MKASWPDARKERQKRLFDGWKHRRTGVGVGHSGACIFFDALLLSTLDVRHLTFAGEESILGLTSRITDIWKGGA